MQIEDLEEIENDTSDSEVDTSEYFYLDGKVNKVLELLKDIHDDSFLYPIKKEVDKRLGVSDKNITICEKCNGNFETCDCPPF